MRRLFNSSNLVIVLFISVSSLFAQSRETPESFRLELTGSAWLLGPTGTLQADGTPVNFVTDLAEGARETHFYGRLIFKPGRKHRLIVEGSPISFSGNTVIDRSIVFAGRTYNVSEPVVSSADITYVYAGYQYDPLTGRYGHLGFQVGAAYLGVQGTLNAIQSGVDESKSFQAPIPLIGTEFRLFPVPHHRIVQLEGMVRGITAGGYGYFIEGGASGGLRFGPIALLAGYREMFANLHQNDGSGDGVALHVKGPIFSLQWAW